MPLEAHDDWTDLEEDLFGKLLNNRVLGEIPSMVDRARHSRLSSAAVLCAREGSLNEAFLSTRLVQASYDSHYTSVSVFFNL